MTGDRDIQNLTRAIKDLTKATTNLDKTLAEIERNRLAEAKPSDALIKMCPVCAMGSCSYGTIVDATVAKGCRCCGVKHEPQALVQSVF